MTLTTPRAIVGDLDKVRSDLDDALGYVRDAWASETDARLTAVVYGMEALMRAVSTLALIVERGQYE